MNKVWTKSSYSIDNGNCVEISKVWTKSSYSADENCVEWRKSSKCDSVTCVEVAHGLKIQVRDSKDITGPILSFSPEMWSDFIIGVKDGMFDL